MGCEKNLTLFIYKAYTYTQYICGMKMPGGREEPLGKRCLQKAPQEGQNVTKMRNIEQSFCLTEAHLLRHLPNSHNGSRFSVQWIFFNNHILPNFFVFSMILHKLFRVLIPQPAIKRFLKIKIFTVFSATPFPIPSASELGLCQTPLVQEG